MDKNTQDAQNVKSYRERYEERMKKRKIKKQITTAKVAAALIFVAGSAVTLGAERGYQNYVGSEYIANDFSEATGSFGYRDDSNVGFIINEGSHYFDNFDDGVNSMVQTASKEGLTDSEIYIGLTKTFNERTAENALGFKMSHQEKRDLYQQRYHQEKSKDENNKGVIR